MIMDPARVPAGVPAGGQFTMTARAETSTLLSPTPQQARFGPNGEHVQALLDRVGDMTDTERTTLAGHAPKVLSTHGREVELFCPAGDATRYMGLPRYRRLSRTPRTSPILKPLAGEVTRALEAADDVAHGLPPASVAAVRDAAVALVLRGRIHAIAYETLTRAVRQTVGRIHPDDGPLHR